MNIDFSKVKNWTIPEGNVKQVADAQGNVLWKSGPQMVTIILYETVHGNWEYGDVTYISHNGTKYTSPATFEAAVGDTINIVCGVNTRYGGDIWINDDLVVRANPAIYDYTVVTNASFDVAGYPMEGWVHITET